MFYDKLQLWHWQTSTDHLWSRSPVQDGKEIWKVYNNEEETICKFDVLLAFYLVARFFLFYFHPFFTWFISMQKEKPRVYLHRQLSLFFFMFLGIEDSFTNEIPYILVYEPASCIIHFWIFCMHFNPARKMYLCIV